MSYRILLLSSLLVWVGCFSEPASTRANKDADMAPDDDPTDMSGADFELCEPQDELCDGEDNDCDGEVDEDFDSGTVCTIGLGACSAEGTRVCTDAQDSTECNVEPLEPTSDELCGDGIDNDCDGATDEGFDLGAACTVGVGVCEVAGTLVCDTTTGAAACDATPLEPPEDPDELTCDALDNDCDGEVDEGCDDDMDGFCDAAFTLVSPAGDGACASGAGDCDDDDDVVYPGAPGLCDGKDNDCVDGVDDIKRRAATSVTIANTYAYEDAETSPIQAVAAGSGYCFILRPPLDDPLHKGGEGYFDAVTPPIVIGRTNNTNVEFVAADIATAPGRCATLMVSNTAPGVRSALLSSFTYDLSIIRGNGVIAGDITHITPSWDASLAFRDDTWIVGWSDTAGSTGSYVTLPVNFDFTSTPDGPYTVGNNGTFPELGLHPGSGDFLFASNFLNINFRELTVGSAAVSVAALGLSSSVNRSSLVMNDVGADHWFAVRHDGTVDAWEISRIAPTLTYDLSGEVPYTPPLEPQEYISRNVFVAGPQATTWFLDTVDEQFVSIADDGAGGLDVVEMADGAATGQLLTGRQISADVTELLWLIDPGGTTSDIEFEIVEYTCH